MRVQEQVHPVKSQGRTEELRGMCPPPPMESPEQQDWTREMGSGVSYREAVSYETWQPRLRKMLAPFMKVMGASDGFRNG